MATRETPFGSPVPSQEDDWAEFVRGRRASFPELGLLTLCGAQPAVGEDGSVGVKESDVFAATEEVRKQTVGDADLSTVKTLSKDGDRVVMGWPILRSTWGTEFVRIQVQQDHPLYGLVVYEERQRPRVTKRRDTWCKAGTAILRI
ncbi:unnamed protein product [Jaminaea pallidilutea]